MKVSYEWLNQYFNGKLPEIEKIEKILTMNSSEVDSVEPIGQDFILDVKILPNLAHSCLCHRGIASELAVLLNLKKEKYSRKFFSFDTFKKSERKLEIKIEDPTACRRYVGRLIEGIKVAPSPEWLVKKMESLGQRSINNLVDATNFLMLEIGQPMHVFDADKLIGNTIEVKQAKTGDMITTLDGKQVKLDNTVLTISNNDRPLAIAGIKGGTIAEIGGDTKNIILESANFDPTLIRKTAQKIKIQTDASKRYENELTPELALEAMDILVKLIVEIAGSHDTKIGELIDIYPNKAKLFEIQVSTEEISRIIGIEITESEIKKIFERFGFKFSIAQNNFVVSIPPERLDLRIKEDLAEEVGRVYGYERVKDIVVPKAKNQVKIYKAFNCKNEIRRILLAEGFSEVINYTFTNKGEIEVANPIASDRNFLRTNLTDGLVESLEFNARHADLIGMIQIKVFEFGHIFLTQGESERFVVGVKNPVGVKKPKEKEVLESTLNILSTKLGLIMKKINKEDNIFETDFTKMIEKISEPVEYNFSDLLDKGVKFKKISAYPFVLRDIAIFTPAGTKQEEVWKIIEKEAGNLLVKHRLFDVFTKKFSDNTEKTSYAYRLVFQSQEKTLSDEEVNKIMDRITFKLNANSGWQVR